MTQRESWGKASKPGPMVNWYVSQGKPKYLIINLKSPNRTHRCLQDTGTGCIKNKVVWLVWAHCWQVIRGKCHKGLNPVTSLHFQLGPEKPLRWCRTSKELVRHRVVWGDQPAWSSQRWGKLNLCSPQLKLYLV